MTIPTKQEIEANACPECGVWNHTDEGHQPGERATGVWIGPPDPDGDVEIIEWSGTVIVDPLNPDPCPTCGYRRTTIVPDAAPTEQAS